jgi:hypothetical protein
MLQEGDERQSIDGVAFYLAIRGGLLSRDDARLAVPSPIPISFAIAAQDRPLERRSATVSRLTLTFERPQ